MKKLLVPIFLFLAFPAWASISVGSYVETSGEPTEQQLNPIKTIAAFEFPIEIQRVGEAVQMVVSQAGYRVNMEDGAKDAYVLFNFSLPAVHRSLGPMTIEHILQALAGPAYQVQINQLYRTVTFGAVEPLDAEIIQQEQLRWQSYTHSAPSLPKAMDYELVRVEKGDSLFIIAKRLGVRDIEQFAKNVFTANREAFIEDDINLIKEGASLRVPKGEERL